MTFRDIGSVQEISQRAGEFGAEVHRATLESQFRCNGSDGYLAWVNHTLQIEETANPTLDGIDFDFRVCGSPRELRELVKAQNLVANKARLVAGYCWDWNGKNDPEIRDVMIPEHDFAMRWNLGNDLMLWILKPDSVDEVGCIHTCQGLELDYVGVIVGLDLVVRDGRVITDAGKRSKQDSSIRGLKKLAKSDPEEARRIADRIIKNTYRTLLTRGQKGCYVFCVDPETNDYFRQRARRALAVLDNEPPYLKVAEPQGSDES